MRQAEPDVLHYIGVLYNNRFYPIAYLQDAEQILIRRQTRAAVVNRL